ncbi:hypothetical protein GCM10023339_01450 [Alloalcanivorax gelatiniphagus]
MPQPVPTTSRLTGGALTCVLAFVTGLAGLVALPSAAVAAAGDEVVAWLEVEAGTVVGAAQNSGDHGNFAGTGSYTFRETGMSSTMTLTAPAAGTYPVWIRYAAGPLSAEENVTRGMGLLTNGTSRQTVSYPLTGSWETWDWAPATVTLVQGTNTLTLQCDRGVETCRLNFDAVQVGGTAADPCAVTPAPAGATRLFDGTFESFDQWRKAGSGGFGQQVVRDPGTGAYDCTLRGFRGQGATWTTAQHAGPYTLDVDWRRDDAKAGSSVYVASSSNGGAEPTGGYQVRIGAGDTGAVRHGATTRPADAAAVAAALRPVGQWNHFAVQVTPRRIRVLLNGTPVNAVDRTAPTGGHIGLENRAVTADVSDQVVFRDIRLTPTVVLGGLAGPARRATTDGTAATQGGESTLGNLVAESQRWATRGTTTGSARIALVSAGALEADLVPAGGQVTYALATSVLDDDALVNMRLTGAQVVEALEQQWRPGGFTSLGASSGLTWTHDAGRSAGDRVTGAWLDGAPLLPAGLYSVTVSADLAAPDSPFPALAGGSGELDTGTDAVAALAAYLGDASAAAPLALPATQRGVGVHVPGGGAASYVAGVTYAVDLSSWSYSAATDPVDTVVDVTVAGRAAGSFPVDDTATPGAYDDRGRVAVRAVLPADLPAGPATVTVVGRTTGTTVRLPITVTAAPSGPTPTPTPTPGPTPAPGPVQPAPGPAPAKAHAGVRAAVEPGRVMAGRTRARLRVTVTGGDATPTGTVSVTIGAKRLTATLRDGRATLVLPKLEAGAVPVKVTYAGDRRTLSAARTVRIRAVRA